MWGELVPPGRRTREPLLRPGLVSISPSSSRIRNASRTDVRLNPVCTTSWRSGGSGCRSRNAPDRMRQRNSLARTSPTFGTLTLLSGRGSARSFMGVDELRSEWSYDFYNIVN